MPKASLTTPNLTGAVIDERYELLHRLGAGTFGVVYKAIDKHAPNDDESRFCAVKLVTKTGRSPSHISSLRRETAMHGHVSGHDNIITLREVFDVEDYVVFVMDLSTGGDLDNFIRAKGPSTDEKTVKTIFLGIVDAIVHMHGLGVYHRDLKPSNVLVDPTTLQVRLADFGLASSDVHYRRRCGTQSFMPPECIVEDPTLVPRAATGPTSDVWALGLLLVNILSSRVPWIRATQSNPNYHEFVRDPQYLLRLLPISVGLNSLLRSIFRPNPAARPSAARIRAEFAALRSIFRPGARWVPALEAGWVQRSRDAPRISDLRELDVLEAAAGLADGAPLEGPPLRLMRCEEAPLWEGELVGNTAMIATPTVSSAGSRSSSDSRSLGSSGRSWGRVRAGGSKVRRRARAIVTQIMILVSF